MGGIWRARGPQLPLTAQARTRVPAATAAHLGLLDEALHLPVLVHHHHAVLGGVLHLHAAAPHARARSTSSVWSTTSAVSSRASAPKLNAAPHLGDEDGGLGVARLVEVQHLLERVLADDVAVEHEEGLAAPVVQQVARQRQRASRAHGLLLLRAVRTRTHCSIRTRTHSAQRRRRACLSCGAVAVVGEAAGARASSGYENESARPRPWLKSARLRLSLHTAQLLISATPADQ